MNQGYLIYSTVYLFFLEPPQHISLGVLLGMDDDHRMYLFTLQLIQIPLIVIGRTPAIKRNKLMGNVVFWLGLYAGFPLLCVAYVAY